MSKILISYRRDDTLALTGRVFDRLVSHFGADSVVMDIDSIPFGTDFRQYLVNAITESDVLVVVIGDRWLQGSGSGKRLDSKDFVRLEIETAMNQGLAVIPLLIGSAQMPNEDDLPGSMKSLVYLNALRIDPGRDFHHHVGRLIETLDTLFTSQVAQDAEESIPDQEQHRPKPDRSSSKYQVELVSGLDKGQVFELSKDRVMIGRFVDCDIPINSPYMSRYHAQFVRMDDGYGFEDLGSSQGSFLNGVRVGDRVALKEGDHIQIGQVVLVYRIGI